MKYGWIRHLMFSLLFVLSTNLFSAPPELVSHPRLWITEKGGKGIPSVGQLQARISDPNFADTWKRLQSQQRRSGSGSGISSKPEMTRLSTT